MIEAERGRKGYIDTDPEYLWSKPYADADYNPCSVYHWYTEE